MFFYNKDMLRKIGKDEAFIEGLPRHGRQGRVHDDRPVSISPRRWSTRAAEIGIIHRPNAGPDYLMTFASFGVKFMDEASGQLLLPKAEMLRALEWFAWNAKNGVTPPNNTAMTWDEIQGAFKTEKAFIFHQGVWAVKEFHARRRQGRDLADRQGGLLPQDRLDSCAGRGQGRRADEPAHPIVYVVNPKSKNADLAAMLVAYATLPYYNVQHAVDDGAHGDNVWRGVDAGIPAAGICTRRCRC